jgi:3-oxoacyl-[acyl-carrier protein] reductase
VKSLDGKTALVTGASSGIGRDIAIRLAENGARVGVHFRSNELGAEQTLASVEAAGGTGFVVCADLAEPSAAETIWSAFDEHADSLDILVNNAGEPSKGGIEAVTETDFDRLFAVNLKSPLLLIKQALPRMRPGGRIINVTTAATYIALPPEIMYLAVKAGLNAATRTLAWALGNRAITVNAVAPGFVDTTLSAPYLADPQLRAWANSLNALGGVAEPRDVSNVVAFLASPEGRWITGQVIDVSGGTLLGALPPSL